MAYDEELTERVREQRAGERDLATSVARGVDCARSLPVKA